MSRVAAVILARWADAPSVIALIGPVEHRAAVITTLAERLRAGGQEPRILRSIGDGVPPSGSWIVVIEDADAASIEQLRQLTGRIDLFCVLGGTDALHRRLRGLPSPPIVLPLLDRPAPPQEAGRRPPLRAAALVGGFALIAALLAYLLVDGGPTAYVPPPRQVATAPPAHRPEPPPSVARPADIVPPAAVERRPPAAQPASLPVAAPLRVAVTYSGDDSYAPALARGIVPVLRRQGIVTADAAPGPGAGNRFVLLYFYAEDQAEVERLQRRLDALLPGTLVVRRMSPTATTRPGDVDLAFDSATEATGQRQRAAGGAQP